MSTLKVGQRWVNSVGTLRCILEMDEFHVIYAVGDSGYYHMSECKISTFHEKIKKENLTLEEI